MIFSQQRRQTDSCIYLVSTNQIIVHLFTVCTKLFVIVKHAVWEWDILVLMKNLNIFIISYSDFWLACRYRGNIHISGFLPDSWLAPCMADLTPDLQECLSWGLIAESFHSLHSLSVSCFRVILGLPGPRFPSTYMSKAVLTAPLERSSCPYHGSLLSFSMRSRSSMPSRTSSSLDLVVTMSCGLTLQICHFAVDAGGLALSMAMPRWHGALRSAHKSCTHDHVFWKRSAVKRELIAVPWTSLLKLKWNSNFTKLKWHANFPCYICV